MQILPNSNINEVSCDFVDIEDIFYMSNDENEHKANSPESSRTIVHLKYVAAIIVFAIAYQINYKHVKINKQNILFNMNGNCFHVHHRLISIILIGLLFRDRFNLKCHND